MESVLFANIRFHDTVSRGRLLNRFGKDFEGDDFFVLLLVLSNLYLSLAGIDSSLANNFGRGMINNLSVTTTLIAIMVIGRWPFLVAMIILSFLYYSCKFVRLFFGSNFDESPQLLNITVRPPGTCDAWVRRYLLLIPPSSEQISATYSL